MFHEIDVGGIYVAPVVAEGVVAAILFLILRFVLGRAGLLHRLWHPALFEVALFVSILSLLVLLR